MGSISSVVEWYGKRDPGLVALRRATRAALVMPVVFILTDRIIGDTTFSQFAAFGSLATLLLVSFSGSKRDHLIEAGAMVLAELALICIGTAVSLITWAAVLLTAVVTFGVFFLSIRKPALSKMTTSLLVSFLLPVTLPADIHAIPGRFLAWLIAGVTSLFAIVYLFPVTRRDPRKEEESGRSEQYVPRVRHAIRTAIAIALSVLAADLFSAQHALWIVLAALAVICSRIASMERKVVDALVGTVIGMIVASGLIAIIGDRVEVCWILLPFTVFYTGFASVAISFTAGQIGFTALLLLISNITMPIGWRIGIIRMEDVFIGCVVSLVVGAVFWSGAATPAKQAA